MVHRRLRSALISIVIVIVCVLAGVWTFRIASRRMSAETLHVRFMSFATKIHGTQRFQFATLTQNEVFEKKSSATVLWEKFNLPDVVVSATAPVEYTYYLDLTKPWRFEKQADVLTVIAPLPKFNEPSVNISELRFEIKKGSILRNEKRVLDILQESMTELLQHRAQENLSLVRETGRKETERFVRQWLSSEKEQENLHVNVRFEDEKPSLSHLP